MYKKVGSISDWLEAVDVVDIYSVSSCISADFCDYINFWNHNGFWLFNNLKIMEDLASENEISLDGLTPFYYRIHPFQWVARENKWIPFEPEASFGTDVVEPVTSNLEGFDVVTFYAQTSAECSPLSCNGLAQTVPVNEHCLLDSFESAKNALETGGPTFGEPGPYRIFEVRTL